MRQKTLLCLVQELELVVQLVELYLETVWFNRHKLQFIQTTIEGWRVNSNTPSLTFNFAGTERHRFDDDGKVALGATPSSFGTITETVEITGY